MYNPDYSPADLQAAVNTEYANVSQFCGEITDLSISRKLPLKQFISSRLNVDNIDCLASILRSNCREQYFGILGKYSQGKRLNLDKTDSWRVLQLFVAGLRINANFTSDLYDKRFIRYNICFTFLY